MANEQKMPEDAHSNDVQSRIEQLEEEVRRLREVMRELIKDGSKPHEHK